MRVKVSLAMSQSISKRSVVLTTLSSKAAFAFFNEKRDYFLGKSLQK